MFRNGKSALKFSLACALLAAPALALAGEHIGHTAAKKMVKAMDEAKITLSDGIRAAEESCKGKAVLAHCEMEKHNLVIAVFCLTPDNKLMDIDVDAKTKKVEESKEVKDAKPGEKKSAEADEDVTPAQAAEIVKALDNAKTTLAALIKTAEDSSKGKSVLAQVAASQDKPVATVFTLDGDKYMESTIDVKTGKVTESKEVPKKEKAEKGEKKEEKKDEKPKK